MYITMYSLKTPIEIYTMYIFDFKYHSGVQAILCGNELQFALASIVFFIQLFQLFWYIF